MVNNIRNFLPGVSFLSEGQLETLNGCYFFECFGTVFSISPA